jgi:general secretion pathway protein B
MSFILDALKKSETERQRQNAPGFASVPEATDPPRAPRWLWVLGSLLAINLVVLLGVMLRPDLRPGTERPAVDTQSEAPAERDATFSQMVEEAKKKQPKSPGDTPEGPAESAGSEVETDLAPPSTAPEKVARTYSTFSELRADGTLVLPDLHLDIHVYSEQPAERFVFVNMNKYREHARLAEGPMVKEITPEGVILSHVGNDFLLPRE